MINIRTVSGLQKAIALLRSHNQTVGFVPTMGALHEGHITLVRECCAGNDCCIVSIFVNPTQFNNKEDLDKYPRTMEHDLAMLEKAGATIVFTPSVEEVYPQTDNRVFDFGELDKVMEGEFRLGHFNGVAQVVSRLFDIVTPDKAYFGEKDFQQVAIIRKMVKILDLTVEIIAMPIKREDSGLAMSSRNQRLSKIQQDEASSIYKILLESKELAKQKTIEQTKAFVIENTNKTNSLDVEYFDIVDGTSLQPISNWTDTEYAVGCIAVFCGKIRLIDNITYYNTQK